jgi:hypothetical protein
MGLDLCPRARLPISAFFPLLLVRRKQGAALEPLGTGIISVGDELAQNLSQIELERDCKAHLPLAAHCVAGTSYQLQPRQCTVRIAKEYEKSGRWNLTLRV